MPGRREVQTQAPGGAFYLLFILYHFTNNCQWHGNLRIHMTIFENWKPNWKPGFQKRFPKRGFQKDNEP